MFNEIESYKWLTIDKFTYAFGLFKNKNNEYIYFTYNKVYNDFSGNTLIYCLDINGYNLKLKDYYKNLEGYKTAKKNNIIEDVEYYEEEKENWLESLNMLDYSLITSTEISFKSFTSFLDGAFFDECIGNDYGVIYEGYKLIYLEISPFFHKYIAENLSKFNYLLYTNKNSIAYKRKCLKCKFGYINIYFNEDDSFLICNQYKNKCNFIKNYKLL